MDRITYPSNTLSNGYRYKEIEIEIRDGDEDRDRDGKKKKKKKEILDRHFLNRHRRGDGREWALEGEGINDRAVPETSSPASTFSTSSRIDGWRAGK